MPQGQEDDGNKNEEDVPDVDEEGEEKKETVQEMKPVSGKDDEEKEEMLECKQNSQQEPEVNHLAEAAPKVMSSGQQGLRKAEVSAIK